jgi:flagellar biosynthesis protein FliR
MASQLALTHFSAMLLFALFMSIVFGITQRAEPKLMVRFGAFCFTLMVGAVIVMSWVMWAIKR